MDEQSLDLDPLFLLLCEVVGTLPLLDLVVKLVNNNRNEQVHDEECGEENVNDEYHRIFRSVFSYHFLVQADAVDRVVHDIRPHLKS